MQDKLELELKDDLNKLEELLARLDTNMALLKSVNRQYQEPEPDINGIRWHCLACGHTWIGYIKLNPEVAACAKCKSPHWNDLPRKGIEGLHKTEDGKPCPLCAVIIKRKLALVEKFKAFEESGS